MILLSSYKNYKDVVPTPIGLGGVNTKAGMKNCAEETRKFAREADKGPPPQNTRSDAADRIRSCREAITWQSAEERNSVRGSDRYKRSVKFLIHCVLAPLYGENIRIVPLRTADLTRRKEFPGRRYFVEAILKALDKGGTDILVLRNRENKIVGLLSQAGPLPGVKEDFDLPELPLDTTKSVEEIIAALPLQGKRVLMYWLKNNGETDCLLYNDLKNILETRERISPSDKFLDVEGIIRMDPVAGLSGVSSFPLLKEHGEAILCDRITVFPIGHSKARFGYDMQPMYYVDSLGLSYVFLPPFSAEAIEAANMGDFSIERIDLLKTDITDNKLTSVTIRYEFLNKSFRLSDRRTYAGQQIRFIRNFPSLTIYGPVPRHGWIARRDLDTYGEYPSPLVNDSGDNTGIREILFEGLEFQDGGDGFGLYTGEIPLWTIVRTKTGEVLGGLPLRLIPGNIEVNWVSLPNFIHPDPANGTMIVAADIGSSRSAVLFHRSGDNEGEINEVFIEEGQPLGVTVATAGSQDVDINFGVMFFQPEKQLSRVEGKTPVGLLTTNSFQNEARDGVSLYHSGKIILLDPKSIAEASTKKILSDIKVGNDKKVMYLFAQGMLTLIVDRAVHLGCSTITIRLSYLIERYHFFKTAWKDAVEKCREQWPGITVQVEMYLPESLAIANELKHGDTFKTTSGAAIVDIGDFSTDIALFMRDGTGQVALQGNVSILFAGRQIILQPIWDYLQFSGARVESLYKPDMMKSPDFKKAVKRLEEALERQKKEKKGAMPDDVRRDLLCLMSGLNRDKIPGTLRNLIDIGYLTEIVLLKRILRNTPPGEGNFDIHLFGGGSSLIDTAFDWGKVLARPSTITPRSSDGKVLAAGLLKEVHRDLNTAAGDAKKMAENYDRDKEAKTRDVPTGEELREGYIRFLQNAQALKNWVFLDKDDDKIATARIFNVKKRDKNRDGEIADTVLFSSFYDDALEFAISGSVDDQEIIKTLFAYKTAYSSVVAFYTQGRH